MKGAKKWNKVSIGPKQSEYAIKKLKSGKRYQVQARDYTKYNGKTLYSKWSKAVTSKKIK